MAPSGCGIPGSGEGTSGSQGSGVGSLSLAGSSSEEGGAPVGRICGNRSIQGTVIPVVEEGAGCGMADPVQVSSVAGVALSPPARMTCETARALNDWISEGVKPELRRRELRLEAIEVSDDLVCVAADAPGHDQGESIDISGFRLAGEDALIVAQDWQDTERGALLQSLHQRACGPFGGTLGPWDGVGASDVLHYDTSPRQALYCR
ncbi:extensin family protein [Amaricoccus macauensis]|uniref:extensin family protein n=1 Tax=Amaricoccus macauensis TaxID=57001 RepID=UPI003C7DFD9B